MGRTGKRRAVEEPETSNQVLEEGPIPTPASLAMRKETHPWLKWPGASKEEKVILNNNLAILQDKPILQPRMISPRLLAELGLERDLKEIFNTRFIDSNGRNFDIPLWSRAFGVNEISYRELCLEFYCSLEVASRVAHSDCGTEKIIHFRLGGKKHEVTLLKFGVLAGFFSEQELTRRTKMVDYLCGALWEDEEFHENRHSIWFELTGLTNHSSTSKAKELKLPILRLIHKLLAYSFLHRSTHHEKVNEQDLWLLSIFAKRDHTIYANAPWILVNYMFSKGAGRLQSSGILCGHFITRMAKNMNLLTEANLRLFSQSIPCKFITKTDLKKAELLKSTGKGIIDEEEEEPEPFPLTKKKYSKSTREILIQMSLKQDKMERALLGLIDYNFYHMNRYQPVLESLIQQQSSSSSYTGPPIEDYNPPPIIRPFQEEDNGEEEDNDDEDDNDAEDGDDDNDRED